MKFRIVDVMLAAVLAVAASLPGAAVPRTISYQGKLTNTNGQPMTGSAVVTFTFWDAETGGSQLGAGFFDTDTVQLDAGGLFTAQIGDDPGNLIPISIFTSDSVYLGISMDGQPLTPRQKLVSSPYALNAQMLGGLTSGAFMPVVTDNWVNTTGDIMTGPLTLPGDGLKVGGSQLVVSGGKVGVGRSNPTSALHVASGSTASMLTLERPGVTGWNFTYTNHANLGYTPTLAIAPDGSPLNLFLPAEAGGMRLYLWEPYRQVPNLPHTGIKPTVAVWGDLLIGDIICIERNPMTLFMRQETGLSASAVTQFFSARAINNDTDGGAGIVMAPDETGAVNSGYLSLIAYGQGTGPLANSIRFSTRSGPNLAADRMIIAGNGNVGIGTTAPVGKLDVNGSIYQRGGLLHADYVFEPDYKLESIEEHSEKMWKQKHLPSVSPRRVDENGLEIVDVGSHQRGILEELEKAHIYIERLNAKIKELENEIELLKRQREQ
ncbi:MAG: hypothetical protein HYX78_11830 [Armatimonadetes bacterium]|nr:hypothetical protein [Armatimonadota bacterium]